MVLVVFSQNVGPMASASSSGSADEFEEQARRLTVADGPSTEPKVAFGQGGVIHVAWIDGRSGRPGVYYKASRDSGETFSGDRALALGFSSIGSVSLVGYASSGLVALAWDGRLGSDSESQVYVRLSADAGRTWEKAALVGAGFGPALAAIPGGLALAYVHGNASTPSQVRVVALDVAGGAVRGGTGLLAFDSSASELALVATPGAVHLVWEDHMSSVSVLAHVSVSLSTRTASAARVIATFRTDLAGFTLTSAGSNLALAWSDDSSGTFDVTLAMSADGGETWPLGGPAVTGAGNAVAPALAANPDGVLALMWRDDRLGPREVFGRLFGPSGRRLTPVFRVSASPAGAGDLTVAFGSARQLVVLWSDARDGAAELYGDLDALLDRPRVATMAMYVKRLNPDAFSPPAQDSKLLLLRLLGEANGLVERREETNAVTFLKENVMTRFDGSLGGSPQDDLVVNATAQADLTRLANRLIDRLAGGSGPGTRAYSGGDGEPDPPGPGDGNDPTPQPRPDPGGGGGGDPGTVYNVTISGVTHTQATVSWNVRPYGGSVSSSWADWGVGSTSGHRTWDNTTPYQVTLSPLQANVTYLVRAGATVLGVAMYSRTYSLFVGVTLTSIAVSNITSTTATVSWTTDLPSTSTVAFGTNESNLVSTATGASGTSHTVNLTGLVFGQTYYARATSVAIADAALVGHADLTIHATLQITSLSRSSTQVAGYYNVTFTWSTNFNGTSQVRYGVSKSLGSTATGANGTSHTVVLHALSSNRSYMWQVYSQVVGGSDYACVSSSGITAVDEDLMDTLCSPANPAVDRSRIVTPPIGIVNVTFGRGETWILATWNTTYLGNAAVLWWQGTGTKHVKTASGSALTHAVNITGYPEGSGLETGMTYTLQLNSTSSNGGDTAHSIPQNVTTKGIAISGTTAAALVTTAWVNWTTNTPGTTVVDYGTRFCGDEATGPVTTNHSLTLSGLMPETTYHYCVRSASSSNANDIAQDVYDAQGHPRTFTTMPGPNDANSSTDAGNTFNAALATEPGTWTGWVNSSAPYSDSYDFYKFQAFANAQIRVTLTVPSTHDLDLHVLTPSNATACSSVTRQQGGVEAIPACNVGTSPGFWGIEVKRYSGSNRGTYTLAFAVLAAAQERFTVDVGAANDDNSAVNTPGISVGSTGWGNRTTSTVASTALDRYRGPPPVYPDYRQVSANGTFYLNLYGDTWERYDDYVFTLQYYSTGDTNVSVWNGAGWVTLAIVPGMSNWVAFSFTLEHTLFYDAQPTWPGLNVELRFEKSIQVDLISAVPTSHTTYVGHGSDDALDEVHTPGVRTLDGWVDAGFGYKNATASGATILATVPDPLAGYLVRLRFDGNSSGFAVLRCPSTSCGPSSGWVFAASASNFTAGEALFTLDPAWYVDAFPTVPGTNVWLKLVPTDRLNEVTQFVLEPVHWTTDVGVAGDNNATLHVPGLSVYPNSEWGSPRTVDGRTVRQSVSGSTPNLYLNLPWPAGSMIAYVTYKSTQAGTVQLWDGSQWTTVGSVTGGNAWRTDILFVQGEVVENGGGGGSILSRMFHDDYGNAFVNANLQFSLSSAGVVTLDAMWVDVDSDGDNLTSYGEPNAYAYDNATSVTLHPGDVLEHPWYAPVEGRWQIDLTVSMLGTRYTDSAVQTSVDGAATWGDEVGYRGPGAPPLVLSPSFPAMLCVGQHRLRIASTGLADATVLHVALRKVPTNPDNPDTDGDGLRDGHEACAKHTDPTSADTDGDGLTDYEEVYAFSYNNATTTYANVTVNVTSDAASELHWIVRTSATLGTGLHVEAVVYLDGQLRWSRNSSSSWTNVDAAFDANLPKGLHSLQVQRATATGTVSVSWVNVTKPRYTNALFWDSDRDGLSDGDELLGKTGWMTSPTKADTDGDGRADGAEIRTTHTDPLLADTDHDGYADGVDVDPLHDLVVQVRVPQFVVYKDSSCSGSGCKYQAYVTIGPNWTRSPAESFNTGYPPVNYTLSVNVPDDEATSVKLQVFNNYDQEMDVSTQSGQTAFTRTVYLTDPDLNGQQTCGELSSPMQGCVWFDIHVVRIGKTNTLLMVPNDWSTLSNGSVDGKATGLHRYVGEQRFAFALLNVTDGAGDLVSYDLETKEGQYPNPDVYADSSGNGLGACHQGDTPISRAVFGGGVVLSGSGSLLMACGPSSATKLDWVNDSMTMAFWVRPDRDYTSGSGWAWSFGRDQLWKLGYYDDGLRFEVHASDGSLYYVSAPFQLYAGRWVHLAATLHQSSMCMYVNGELLGSCNGGPGAVEDGNTNLYLGWDEASGPSAGHFKGAVDEFRLYKEGLPQDGIRGMMWFLGGANSILIPRGVLYDSLLFKQMTGNGSALLSGPLNGAYVHANDNNGSAHLNGRVIQMVIDKNLTLADAYAFLGLLWTNKTGNLTAFAYPIAGEFYTLGFEWEVSKLVANATVPNSGNYTEAPPPPPPPAWYDVVWNTIVGAAQFLWNAAVAVATFFVAAVVWLANVFVGVTIGLLTGNWTYFQENVVEPFVEALEALISFMVSLFSAIVQGLLSGMNAMFAAAEDGVKRDLSFIYQRHFDPSDLPVVSHALYIFIVWNGLFALALVIAFLLSVLEKTLLQPFEAILEIMQGILIIVLPIVLLAVLAVTVTPSMDASGDPMSFGSHVSNQVDLLIDLPYAIADLLLSLFTMIEGYLGKIGWAEARAFALAFLSLFLVMVADTPGVDPLWAVIVDLLALVVLALGTLDVEESAIDMFPLLGTMAIVLTATSFALDMRSLIGDLQELGA